jgi:LacI family transcriptional regulator
LRRWPRAIAPDALIIGWPADQRVSRELGKFAPTAKRIVTLDWQPGGVSGMDVNNETIAASAVDLVIAQLHRNERGIPASPTTLLLDGTWRESSV